MKPLASHGDTWVAKTSGGNHNVTQLPLQDHNSHGPDCKNVDCWSLPHPGSMTPRRLRAAKCWLPIPPRWWSMIHISHRSQTAKCWLLIPQDRRLTIHNLHWLQTAECWLSIHPGLTKNCSRILITPLATLNSLTVWCLPVWKLVHNILIVKTCFLYFNWDIWATYCHLFQEER